MFQNQLLEIESLAVYNLGQRAVLAHYLADKEEKQLSTFLTRCGSIGYPQSKAQALALVQRILESRGFSSTISTGWWSSFRKRHPEVVLPRVYKEKRACNVGSAKYERGRVGRVSYVKKSTLHKLILHMR